MKNQDNKGIPTYTPVVEREKKGLGPDSAGQSGDTQGLPDSEDLGSESVEELMEEGQTLEAALTEGVENAGEPGEVRVRQVPTDDVPEEYLEQD